MQRFEMLKSRIATFGLLLALAGMILIGRPLSAQGVYGSIYGTVLDKSGAVVPNATVTANKNAQKRRDIELSLTDHRPNT